MLCSVSDLRFMSTSTDPPSLVLSPFHSLLYTHMLSHAHTQSWFETSTQRSVPAATHTFRPIQRLTHTFTQIHLDVDT